MGQRPEPGRAVLACRVVETDEFARWCRRRGCQAAPRDSVTRRLAHEPLGWRPTTLLVTIRRYRCTGCGHVCRQDTAGPPSDPLADITLLGKPENVVAVVQAGVVRKNTMLAGDVGSWDRGADADSSGPSRR